MLVPSRGAYLIKAGSHDGFRRAVQEASTRWGGQCEPIIPVYASRKLDPWSRQVIEVSGVDGLINVDLPEATVQRVARQLGLSVVPVDQVDRWGDTKWTAHPAVVESWAGDPQPPVAGLPDAPLWEVASAGAVSASHAQGLTDQGLALSTLGSMPDQLARAQVLGSTLIRRTTRQFTEYAGSNGPFGFPTILWVAKPDSLVDCLHFWNQRALAPLREPSGHVLLLPVGQVQHWLHFPEQFHGQLVRPDEFDPDVILLSYSVPDEGLDAEAEQLGLTRSKAKMRSTRSFGVPNRTAPFTYLVDKDPRQFLVFGRKYGLQMQTEAFLETPRTVATLECPISFSGMGYSRLELRSPAFAGFPERPQVAEMILPNATWREGALEIRTHTYSRYSLDLSIPTLQEITEAILTRTVASWELSEKGKLALPLMRSEVLALCRHPESAGVVAALTTPRSKELERQLKALSSSGGQEAELLELAARWGGRAERRYRRASQLPGKQALALVERWCGLGLAERGLGITCSTCGVPCFVTLADGQSQATCPGCGSGVNYDTEGKGLAIYYRLSSFLDRASDQGTLPVLMAIAALTSQSEHTYLMPGVNLTLHDGRKTEVDLFGIHKGLVLAGEVKMTAAQFTTAQISRDVELSCLLKVDTHVMTSLDEIPESVAKAAGHLCAKAQLSLTALSSAQLPG